jgi:hypothetical protein
MLILDTFRHPRKIIFAALMMERKRRNRKVFLDLKGNKNLSNVETKSRPDLHGP